MVCAIDKSLDKFRANDNLIGQSPEMYELLGLLKGYLQKLVFDDIGWQVIMSVGLKQLKLK